MAGRTAIDMPLGKGRQLAPTHGEGGNERDRRVAVYV